MSGLSDRVRKAFADHFGGTPDLIARAPGRVNLIGEHTDYNDGFVLPAAIGVHSLVAARRTAGREIIVLAADYDGAISRFTLNESFAHDRHQPWADHVRGMLCAMQAAGHDVPGAELVLAGSIPQGSGLSSSASVAVALGTAFNALAGLGLDATAIARLAQASECDFVGTRCGIMDQLASARGKSDHALLIDCRSLACKPVKMPSGLAILIVHSGITRGLVDGEYNQRRSQCEAAADALGVAALRDASLSMLASAAPGLDPRAIARARHVISENERTLEAAGALARGDLRLLGQLMAASHASLRDDFEVSLPAIDALVELLQSFVGAEGGARMTGGGFGGAVVALCRDDQVERVIDGVRVGYRTPSGGEPMILREQASDGASLLSSI